MSAIAVEFTRKKLYEEIWKLSVAGVARSMASPMPNAWRRPRKPDSRSSLWLLDQNQFWKIGGTDAFAR